MTRCAIQRIPNAQRGVCFCLAGLVLGLGICSGRAVAQAAEPSGAATGGTHAYVDQRHEFRLEGEPSALSFRLLEPSLQGRPAAAPMLIYLHGAGGSLDEVNLMRAEYDRLRDLLAERGYYILMPALGPSHWMNETARRTLDQIVERVLDKYPIDSRQVHIMGTSMGGGAALAYAMHRPDLVRSVCSHLGMTDMVRWHRETNGYGGHLNRAFGGGPDSRPEAYQEVSPISNLDAFANIPVFLISGATDPLVPPAHGRRLAGALTAKGFHAVYREHPSEGHTDRSIRGFELDLAVFFDAAGQVVRIVTTPPPNAVRFGVLGPWPKRPAPTLFIFAGSNQLALGEAYFRQAGNRLREQGWLCVSLDLPCHGEDHRPNEPGGLSGWRRRIEDGEDFVTPWTAQVSRVLDYLIAEGYSDPDRIAACGTSRGGYLALQAAGRDRRIDAVAAFAPVTNLASLREFRGAEANPTVMHLSVAESAASLADRAVWLVIGNRDDRVDTDETIALARSLCAEAVRKKQPSRVELHVLPVDGHTTPPGASVRAADWIQSQFR